MKCIPLSLTIHDHFFEVDALNLVHHTTKRILEFLHRQNVNFDWIFDTENANEIKFLCKFGIDGAQSRTKYAMKFFEDGNNDSNFDY